MSNRIEVKTSSIGFGSLLTIVFIALKLMGYINWSWLWVLSPLWIPIVIMIGILIILFSLALLAQLIK